MNPQALQVVPKSDSMATKSGWQQFATEPSVGFGHLNFLHLA
jgi:hypothetical protein